jgi:CO/xanthine dehydrogenase FAD-binding subunit
LTDLAKDRGGTEISHDVIRALADAAADRVEVRSDFRASAGYRKHLIRTLAARCILAAAGRAGARLED